MTFLLTIGPAAPARGQDIMYTGVSTPEDYKQQAMDLNFDWENLVELDCGGATYQPVLSSFENTYGLTQNRNVVLVFTPATIADSNFFCSDDVVLTFRDHLFGTGIQKFRFERTVFDQAPSSKSAS